MYTVFTKPDEARIDWYVVDAAGKTLGRLASQIAHRLKGKHKPNYAPHQDLGDHIVVINAGNVRVTGAKLTDKFYHQHTGYVGNLKSIVLGKLLAEHPERAIEFAIKGMLPKGPLGRRMYKKLHVFGGSEHPHQAQQPKVLAPHVPIAPKIQKPFPWAKPVAPQSAVGGLWITGPSMKSLLYLRNDLKTDSLIVTPVLYLSNGVRYPLPPVTLEPTGTAVVDIGQSLEAQSVASYAKLYGYVEIDYQWPWAVVCATIRNVDALNSLIFTSAPQPPADRFPQSTASAAAQAAGQPPPTVHQFEGLWWKQENNVAGFLALANLSAQPVSATVNVTGNADAVLGTYQVSISPHATKMLDLTEIKLANATAGGVYLSHDGPEHSLAINGGLFDDAVGYSARLFLMPVPEPATPGSASATTSISYASLGLMNGLANPMMSFPAGTAFTPYAVARNISGQPALVTPTLWWMNAGTPQSAQLPQIVLGPHQTMDLNVPGLLFAAGLRNFNASFNLVLDTAALPGALTITSGSVDKKNTYVFEVMPKAVGESAGKSISYWSTANGDDTMTTLWNPADEDQDLLLTVFFTGGHYLYPIHLAARATRSLNISEISHSGIPDSEGNTIPSAIHDGSFEIAGSLGDHQHILLAQDTGIYNVNKAVCGQTCETCQGFTTFTLLDNPFSTAVGGTKQQTLYMQWSTGGQYYLTTQSSWSSSATNIATVTANGGMVSGVGPGSVTVSAYYGYTEPPYVANICSSGTPTCPQAGPFNVQGPGTVQKPGFLKVESRADSSTCSNSGCMAQIQYQVLDLNGKDMAIPGMAVQESSSVSAPCSGTYQDASTWFTNGSGYLIGTDNIHICAGTANCTITITQTFTVDGFPVLIMSNDGVTTGTKNVITITLSHGTSTCPRIVITP